MKKYILSTLFLTTLLSSCITIGDEPDILIDEYIVFQDDTVFRDTINIKP